MNEHCNPELIRKHEELILMNQKTIEMFIERYNLDRKECAERYARDREEARDWRESFNHKLERVDDTLREINEFMVVLKPAYNNGTKLAWIVILSALGIIFTVIWNHVTK